MDLHGIVSGAIGAVNPSVPVTVQFSVGYVRTPSGKRTPSYSTAVMMAQVQSLTYDDLQHLDGQNIQGIRRAMYLSGDVESIVRMQGKGGDLITMADGSVYKTVLVIERWDGPTVGWCKVAVTRQD